MRTTDVITFYGSKAAASRAIGLTRASVTKWGAYVPCDKAVLFQAASRGKLKCDPQFYARLAAQKKAV